MGEKIKGWYEDMKRVNVRDGEMVGSEMRRDLDVMEEDEEGVVYFEVMELGE
ncbi:response regulator aspartate phosphatase, partial [Bacillus pumilus]